jgi:hypothetical protein
MPQENRERNLIGFLQKSIGNGYGEEATARASSTLCDLYEPAAILSRRKKN